MNEQRTAPLPQWHIDRIARSLLERALRRMERDERILDRAYWPDYIALVDCWTRYE